MSEQYITIKIPALFQMEFEKGNIKETLDFSKVPSDFLVDSILGSVESKIGSQRGKKGESLQTKRINVRKAIQLFQSGIVRPRGRTANPLLKQMRGFIEGVFRDAGADAAEIKALSTWNEAQCESWINSDSEVRAHFENSRKLQGKMAKLISREIDASDKKENVA